MISNPLLDRRRLRALWLVIGAVAGVVAASSSALATPPCPSLPPCYRAAGSPSLLAGGESRCFDPAQCVEKASWIAVGRIQKVGVRTQGVTGGGELRFTEYDLIVRRWEKGGHPSTKRVRLTEGWCGPSLPSEPGAVGGTLRIYGRGQLDPRHQRRHLPLALRPLTNGRDEGNLCSSRAPADAGAGDAGRDASEGASTGSDGGLTGSPDATAVETDAAGADTSSDGRVETAPVVVTTEPENGADPQRAAPRRAPPGVRPSARGCGCGVSSPGSGAGVAFGIALWIVARRRRKRGGAVRGALELLGVLISLLAVSCGPSSPPAEAPSAEPPPDGVPGTMESSGSQSAQRDEPGGADTADESADPEPATAAAVVAGASPADASSPAGPDAGGAGPSCDSRCSRRSGRGECGFTDRVDSFERCYERYSDPEERRRRCRSYRPRRVVCDPRCCEPEPEPELPLEDLEPTADSGPPGSEEARPEPKPLDALIGAAGYAKALAQIRGRERERLQMDGHGAGHPQERQPRSFYEELVQSCNTDGDGTIVCTHDTCRDCMDQRFTIRFAQVGGSWKVMDFSVRRFQGVCSATSQCM